MIDPSLSSTLIGALATVGLFVYAAVETQLQRKAEQTRQRERSSDDARADDTALYIANAEMFRLWSIARQAATADLSAAAQQGALSPEDYLPADTASLMNACARLGFGTGVLASYALANARDASVLVRGLVASTGKLRSDVEAQTVADIRDRANEAAALLEDAINQSPRARMARSVDTTIPMKSMAGRRILEVLQQRGAVEVPPKELPSGS